MAKRFPRAGELRQRVFIKNRSDEESGSYSGESEHTATATAWCKIENLSGITQVDSRNAGGGITHRITMRYRVDISAQDELFYQDGRGESYRYQVQTIQNVGDERNRFLSCDCLQMEKSGEYFNPSPAANLTPDALLVNSDTFLAINESGDYLAYT